MVKKFITLLIFIVFIWLIWSYSGRNTPIPLPKSYISVISEINPADSLNQNILGIQPFMEVSDYFNQNAFQEKVRQYLVSANYKGFLKEENSLIVYPENIGTWLILLGEKHEIMGNKTFETAKSFLMYSNIFDFMLGYFKTGKDRDKKASAIFRMKAKAMLHTYQSTFSTLAKETKTHIVAGSIVLPGPKVVEGQIYIELNAPLYNCSFVFGPDGKIVGDPILKSILTAGEKEMLTAGDPGAIPVFDLPIGKTAVLIGDDSWNLSSSQQLSDADVIISPSFFDPEYSRLTGIDTNSENDFEFMDTTLLAKSEQLTNFAQQEYYPETAIFFEVYLHGDLWDFYSEGLPTVRYKGKKLPLIPAGLGGVWALNL
ncbi:hypothetical protein PBT90_12115 [Algoriphagus halophytocola]|uniref:Uncharacterized protein n=1 Tax=Algoriphagus halophytocola TaxID=2991499 RepID=A0ABY6MPG0_9BACT|nr:MULTISPECIES: hypothetical protein [unclassified Algoriphagus]UZD24129.1 hypothetical protein OM944_06425 [Algoriphagus sp. TR-M5]WBL41500.1 hypothetical protein PBT90_12115 [Algoriphagus sp. TR-M9]